MIFADNLTDIDGHWSSVTQRCYKALADLGLAHIGAQKFLSLKIIFSVLRERAPWKKLDESFQSNKQLVVGISPLTKEVLYKEVVNLLSLTNKRVQHRKNDAVCYYLWNCNCLPCFDKLSVLFRKNKKYLSGLKESCFIMEDRPFINRNMHYATLYLFE